MTRDIRCLNSIIRWQIHLSRTSVFTQRRLHSFLSVPRIAFGRLSEECNRPRANGAWTILRPSACKLNGECVCLLRLFRASHQCKYKEWWERWKAHHSMIPFAHSFLERMLLAFVNRLRYIANALWFQMFVAFFMYYAYESSGKSHPIPTVFVDVVIYYYISEMAINVSIVYECPCLRLPFSVALSCWCGCVCVYGNQQ